MSTKFQQFIRERKYIMNVSPRTLDWYAESLKWLGIESPTQDDLTSFVIRMREAGLSASSCNNRIRAVNAYLHWASGCQGKCSSGCQHSHASKLQEPSILFPVFTPAQVKLLVSWKASGFYDKRLHLLVLLLFDCGLRISEALNVRVQDVDLDNLLLTVRLARDGSRG